ncbi:hypothetical protein V8C34DRAFT_324308 [Trichoderma compactum]
MDVDSPSTQPETATSQETQTAIRERNAKEWREELRKLVDNVPWEFRELHGGLTDFGEELDRDMERIQDDHRSIEERASETEINHPEVSFKKNLNRLRERLEKRIGTGYELKALPDGMVEKLENICKRVDEFEKLMEQ